MKYRVNFEFYNELGEWVETFLDNNEKGFTKEEAMDVARQLRERECKHVHLEFMR